MTYRQSALFRLVEVAEKILANEIGPIEGARKISELRVDVGDPDNEVFTRFSGIDSESDDLVVGNRALWSEAFVQEVDRRYEANEQVLRPDIADDCRALLAVLSRRLHECPVCGFTGSDRLPYDAAGTPSYETCASCGFEFGVTDVMDYGCTESRRRWVRDGIPYQRPPPPSRLDP